MGGHISEPAVTFQIIPAQQLAGVQEQKVLIVGQLLSAGTATAGALIQDHPSDGTENTLFGRTSHVAGLVREFKKLNKISRLDIIPLADGGSAVKGTAICAFAGAATENGTVYVSIASKKNHRFKVDITTGDAATAVGDALVALITADLDAPFTAANTTGTVTATAANGGTLSSDWDIIVEGAVAGITTTLTGWTGGATDPALTSILDVIANIRYQTVVWPSVYALTVIEDELNARFNVSNDVKDGIAIQVKAGTLATIKSYVAALNSQSLAIVGNKAVATATHKGAGLAEMPDVVCSHIAAIRALRLTEGAVLSQFLTTVARSDQFGGIALASLPYFNTSLPLTPIPSADQFFTQEELDEMRDNAVAIVGPNRAFNGTIMGEMVTTYLTDVAGNPDDSFKFVNTVDTESVIREFFFENAKKRYAQTRLTDGDLIAGKDMANAGSIRAFANELYDVLAEAALVQAGRAAKQDYNDNLIITINVRTGTATIDQAPLLVTQLRALIGTIAVNFGG